MSTYIKRRLSFFGIILLISIAIVGCENNSLVEYEDKSETVDRLKQENLSQEIEDYKSNSDESLSEQEESESIYTVNLTDIDQNDAQWWKNYNETVTSFSSQVAEEGTEHVIAHTINFGPIENSESELDLKARLDGNDLLTDLVENSWDEQQINKYYTYSDVQFRLYNMYLTKGIAVKSLNDKVFNVIYDTAYKAEIMDGISMATSKEAIISILGTPHFSNSQLKLFGYCDSRMYIFFYGDEAITEVSMYRNDVKLGYDSLMSILEDWSKNDDISLIDQLDEAKEFDWIGGVSSRYLVGYEAKGLTIEYDLDTSKVRFNVFRNADPQIKEELLSEFSESVTMVDRDAIFDLEQYRILMDQTIRGLSITDPATLGMAFSSTENFIFSPDQSLGIYIKRATIDDNYASMYITDLVSGKPYDEQIIDPNYADVYWINNEYIACIGSDIRYVYRVEDKKIIPLPTHLFGENFHILSMDENMISYK